MILTIHQPEHLPWLGYFHKMASADRYVLLDNVQYRHHYFQNRNQILGREPNWVNVPVLKTQTLYGRIDEQLIDNTRPWRQKYWGAIECHYHRHPYFERYAEPLQRILMTPFDLLVDLNLALIDFFREALGIHCPLVRASSLPVEGKRSDLLAAICRQEGATAYLSGPSGRNYLDLAPFEGIEVRFHEFIHPIYPQHRRNDFTPNLSTLDLLMNCGPESRTILLSGFPLSQSSGIRPSAS